MVNVSSPDVGGLGHQLRKAQVQEPSGDGVGGLLDSAHIEVPSDESRPVILDPGQDGICCLYNAATAGTIDIDAVHLGQGEDRHLEVGSLETLNLRNWD